MTYHVFIDNLFSSPDLFRYLWQMGIGATSTCRIHSGIYEGLAKMKSDGSGKTLRWGSLTTVPTADNIESI